MRHREDLSTPGSAFPHHSCRSSGQPLFVPQFALWNHERMECKSLESTCDDLRGGVLKLAGPLSVSLIGRLANVGAPLWCRGHLHGQTAPPRGEVTEGRSPRGERRCSWRNAPRFCSDSSRYCVTRCVCVCARASVRVATEMIGIQVLLKIGFLTSSNSCLSGEWAAK